MVSQEIERRRLLSFKQAEGTAPLPSQLAAGVITPEMRVRLWKVFHEIIKSTSDYDSVNHRKVLGRRWKMILADYSLEELYRFADDFKVQLDVWLKELRALFETGKYDDVFGFIQFTLRHPGCPEGLATVIDDLLTTCRAAYRVID